ncbi:hypothetical protein B0T25DRAFT_568144 [Lasiosphaeria hispida]|uniref:Uncharacterized protein n=1 Tax=Lasiosphaeria hispida TaxID=260671 RepID=A0AAJ0MDZ1_9PEZI|nr:hypothetical protein B0T25DRAFT_568144 [Lasiosphaeria hispida]
MPTTRDFEDILAGIAVNICEALPTVEDRLAYREWLQVRREALRAPPTAGASFNSLVDTASLIGQTFRTKLTRSTRENPELTVPIGSDADYLYRLVVYPYYLRAHDQNCSYRSLDGTEELLDCSILGRSTQSAESDDEHGPSFVFFQLRPLQYTWRNDEDGGLPGSAMEGAADMDDDDDAEDDVEWLDTNFCLVARLGQSGRSTGIYAVYNMFQAYAPTGARLPTIDGASCPLDTTAATRSNLP